MLTLATACTDVEVKLPASLSRFGDSTTIRIDGNSDRPVIVALGGISATRFVCTTADDSSGWWSGLVGKGWLISPEDYCVVGLDFVADETGRTAPTPQDQAEALAVALEAVGLNQVLAIIGASYGGMVALSFADLFPERIDKLVIVSAAAEPHPAASAARELQRRVVELGLKVGKVDEALSIARGMAMMTYRTAEEFAVRFRGGLAGDDPLLVSEPGAYLRSRGAAFTKAMSAERFLSLSASIDRHRIDPKRIATPSLLIGASTDQLVPPGQMRALADNLAGPSSLHLLESLFGHDMFLKEASVLAQLVKPFLEEEK